MSWENLVEGILEEFAASAGTATCGEWFEGFSVFRRSTRPISATKTRRPLPTKPTETKPTETKPTETKPTETKPAETKPEKLEKRRAKRLEERSRRPRSTLAPCYVARGMCPCGAAVEYREGSRYPVHFGPCAVKAARAAA